MSRKFLQIRLQKIDSEESGISLSLLNCPAGIQEMAAAKSTANIIEK
jgi:hypothetical protein